MDIPSICETLDSEKLALQNSKFRNTGGVSADNRASGFIPAFYDANKRQTHISRFADGRPAPIHILDGLPKELIIERCPNGKVKAVASSVEAGFMLNGEFYTRSQAAEALELVLA